MIKAILAHDFSFGIGLNNALPWPHNKADMKFFSKMTTDNVVVMGRRTFESLGSVPLPRRINIVVTNSDLGDYDYLAMEGDMGEILQKVQDNFPSKDVFVIGGSDIYSQAIYYCEEVYVTVHQNHYDCDTFLAQKIQDNIDLDDVMYEDNEITIYKGVYDAELS